MINKNIYNHKSTLFGITKLCFYYGGASDFVLLTKFLRCKRLGITGVRYILNEGCFRRSNYLHLHMTTAITLTALYLIYFCSVWRWQGLKLLTITELLWYVSLVFISCGRYQSQDPLNTILPVQFSILCNFVSCGGNEVYKINKNISIRAINNPREEQI